MEYKFVVEDEALFLDIINKRYSAYSGIIETTERKLVITKDIFVECYKKWILENPDIERGD